MNTTLKPATNLMRCAVWIVLIVLSLTVFSFVRWAVGIVGGALGLIAGFLQARAWRANSHQFGEAGSILDVQKVMTSSAGGKSRFCCFRSIWRWLWFGVLRRLLWGRLFRGLLPLSCPRFWLLCLGCFSWHGRLLLRFLRRLRSFALGRAMGLSLHDHRGRDDRGEAGSTALA
jgi:hypothetical protein